MSEPFLAEVRIVGFTFAPRGWAFCDGQILPINQNQSLYSLLGTTYGGDGRTSFALPDMRGRTPIHVGDGHQQGQKSGGETVSLTIAEIPGHNHTAVASSATADQATPGGNLLAKTGENIYGASASTTLDTGSITHTGSGQGHENMQPWLALNFCIALTGLFPSRN